MKSNKDCTRALLWRPSVESRLPMFCSGGRSEGPPDVPRRGADVVCQHPDVNTEQRLFWRLAKDRWCVHMKNAIAHGTVCGAVFNRNKGNKDGSHGTRWLPDVHMGPEVQGNCRGWGEAGVWGIDWRTASVLPLILHTTQTRAGSQNLQINPEIVCWDYWDFVGITGLCEAHGYFWERMSPR